MAAKKILLRLNDEQIIKSVFEKYAITTGDYNLADRMDETSFSPCFNAAMTSVDIFNSPLARKLSFPLSDLVPDIELGLLLAELAAGGISHGYIFETGRSYDLLPFYRMALAILPQAHMAQLVFWKRAAHGATDRMLPGRRQLWEELWRGELNYIYTFHPSIMLSMTSYKGPIPLFLQQVYAYLLCSMGGRNIDLMYRAIICQEWLFPKSAPRLTALWHQIMKETVCVYIPKPADLELDISTIVFHVGDLQWISNADKFLCLLLALFHGPYREKIAQILREEPPAPFLADLFARFPSLKP